MPKVVTLSGRNNIISDVEGFGQVLIDWELYFSNYSRLNNTADLFVTISLLWDGSAAGFHIESGSSVVVRFSRNNEYMYEFTGKLWDSGYPAGTHAPSGLKQVTLTKAFGTINFDNWDPGDDLVEISATCGSTFHSIIGSFAPENYLIPNTTGPSENLYLPREVVKGVVSIFDDTGNPVLYVPTIYDGTTWDEYTPTLYNDSKWNECSI